MSFLFLFRTLSDLTNLINILNKKVLYLKSFFLSFPILKTSSKIFFIAIVFLLHGAFIIQLHGEGLIPKSEISFVPIPNSLVGYRTWSGSQAPKIKIIEIKGKVENPKSNPGMQIKIDAPLAMEMKLSDDPEFKNAPWRKVDETISWISRVKPNQDVYTIYGVFRYKNTANNRYEISPIVHDSIKTDALYKKITRTAYGYFDWYELSLVTHNSQKKKVEEEHFYQLQKKVEFANSQKAYQTLEKLQVLSGFNFKDFFYLNPEYVSILMEAIKKMKLTKAYYPDQKTIFVEQKVDLLLPENQFQATSKSRSIYQYVIKNLFKKELNKNYENFGSQNIEHLVIDVRNQGLIPALLWKLIDDDNNQVILSPALHDSKTVPFVRYIRDIKYFTLPKNSLVIKATDINNTKNTISILSFYSKILLSSKEQLEKIANGNFYLLVD